MLPTRCLSVTAHGRSVRLKRRKDSITAVLDWSQCAVVAPIFRRDVIGRTRSCEVDIAPKACFICAFQQAKQRRTFCRTRPASDDDNDAVMSLSRRKLDEVVAVTGEQQATLVMRRLGGRESLWPLVGVHRAGAGIRGRVLGVGRSGPRVHHGRAGTSRLLVRHLSRHQQINFSPMILVVCKTLVYLSPRERRKTRCPEGLNGFAVLQKTDDIMHGNPRAFDPSIPAAYVRRSNDVSIGFGYLAHGQMVRDLTLRINSPASPRPPRTVAELSLL